MFGLGFLSVCFCEDQRLILICNPYYESVKHFYHLHAEVAKGWMKTSEDMGQRAVV